jgi:nucleolar protein 56
MNKDNLQKQFVKDLNSYLSKNKDVINAVKALEVVNYLTTQSNSIFDYVYKWHGLEYPELYAFCSKDNSKYIKTILELESSKKDSIMSGSIGNDAIEAIKSLCNLFLDFEKNSNKLKKIIEKSAKAAYPNLSTLLGPILATKFISQVGSLERLSKMPSSSLQLIGAESALFKHLKFGKKCPKYGFLYLHPLMQGLNNKQKGKLSRYFAGKIELAVRADMYTKNNVSGELLKDLEKKKLEIKKTQ